MIQREWVRDLLWISGGLVLLASWISISVGLSPWLLVISALLLSVSGLSKLFPPYLAMSGVVLVVLTSLQWLILISPHTSIPMGVSAGVIFLLIGFAGVVLGLVRFRTERSEKSKIPTWLLLTAVVPGSAYIIAGIIKISLFPSSISWAMGGDAQFNTVLSRLIGLSNGQLIDQIPVISLAQGLMALSHIPGRGQVSSVELLIHDVGLQAQLWILLIGLTSILLALITIPFTRRARLWFRIVTALLLSAFPLTWYLTGYAIYSGFYNINLVFIVLVAAIGFYTISKKSPILALIGQTLAVTVTLGAWTPLAVLPVGLGLSILYSLFRDAKSGGYRISGAVRKPNLGYSVTLVGAVTQLLLFIVVFTIPAYLAVSNLLSNNGSVLSITVPTLLFVGGMLLAIGLVQSQNQIFPLEGVIGLFLAGFAGVGFLVFQNRGLEDVWIYYPRKFAWVFIALCLVVIALLSIQYFSEKRSIKIRLWGGIAATLVFIATLLANGPFNYSVSAIFPGLAVIRSGGNYDASVRDLSEVANTKTVFSHFDSELSDLFKNQWLFQLTVKSEHEEIRNFAYDVVDEPFEFCKVSEAWDGQIKVITSDQDWAQILRKTCGDSVQIDFR